MNLRKLITKTLAALSMVVAGSAHAGYSIYTVDQIHIEYDTNNAAGVGRAYVFVNFDPAQGRRNHISPPLCVTQFGVYTFRTDNPQGRALVQMLVQARLTNTSVLVGGSNVCDQVAGYETLTTVVLGRAN